MINESTPELADVYQNDEPDSIIEVPVRVVDIGPVQVHTLPARDAVMGSLSVDSEVQLLASRDMRRKSITLWATADTASGFVFVGTDKSQVEAGTCARLPAPVDTFANGIPMKIVMTHIKELWVRNSGDNTVTVSYASEFWAD